MPFPIALPLLAKILPPAIGAIGSILGSRKSARTGTSGYSQTTTSGVDPQYSPLQAKLIEMVMARIGSPSALPAGYAAGGIGSINRVSNLLRQRRENDLTSRGLAGSPVAASADATAETGRGASLAEFLNSLPLVERDMRNEDLTFAQRVLALAPRTTTSTGSGERVAAGDPLATGVSSLAEILGELFGKGALGSAVKLPDLAKTLPPFDPRNIYIPTFPGRG